MNNKETKAGTTAKQSTNADCTSVNPQLEQCNVSCRSNENIQKGMWYTYCCHEDLKQIETEEELKEVIDSLDSEELQAEVWSTEKDALIEIKSRWKDKQIISEIDLRLSLLNGG